MAGAASPAWCVVRPTTGASLAPVGLPREGCEQGFGTSERDLSGAVLELRQKGFGTPKSA